MTLTVDVETARVRLGEAIEVPVSVSGTERAMVTVGDLPPGVLVSSIDLEASAGALSITAAADAEVGGPFPLTVMASRGDQTASISLALYVAGASGAPDTSFSFDGQATYQVIPEGEELDHVQAAVFDARGRILVGGITGDDPWVVRLLPNGTIDSTFAENGELTTFGLADVMGVTVDSTERVLVFAQDLSGPTPASSVSAFTEDGQTDSSFGEGGVRSLSILPVLRGGGIVAQDDRIFVWDRDDIVALSASGVVDGGFSPATSEMVGINEVAIDPNGGILVMGWGDFSSYTIKRLLPDGAADTTFGNEGLLVVPLPDDGLNAQGSTRSAVFDDRGGVVLASSESVAQAEFPRFLRFNNDGTADSDFGTRGLAPLLFDLERGAAVGLLRVPDGSLVSSTRARIDYGRESRWINKFGPDGSPDLTFGQNGRTAAAPSDVLLYDAEAERIISVGDETDDDPYFGRIVVSRFWL